MIVAHAVHYLVAAPAALVLLGIAVATLVDGRRSHRRGPAVLRDEEGAGAQPPATDAATPDRAASSASDS